MTKVLRLLVLVVDKVAGLVVGPEGESEADEEGDGNKEGGNVD